MKGWNNQDADDTSSKRADSTMPERQDNRGVRNGSRDQVVKPDGAYAATVPAVCPGWRPTQLSYRSSVMKATREEKGERTRYLLRICRTRMVCVYTPVQCAPIKRGEAVQEVGTCGVVVVSTHVIWEVVAQW
jgi:hypothetical protein